MIRINEKVSKPKPQSIFTFSPSVKASSDCKPHVLISSRVKDFIIANKAPIFFDTCSILELEPNETEQMFLQLVCIKADIVILSSVVNELHKLSKTSTAQIKVKASYALRMLRQLNSKGYLRIELTNLPDFSDPNFLIVLTEQIVYNDIILVTQDRGLQTALMDMQTAIGKISSRKHKALICRIDKPSPSIIAC